MEISKETKLNFPPGFLLGAASSAHQVEGNNTKNDWWHYEQQGKLPKSGDACDHYNRFEEDFNIAKDIGLNAMRISLEWSRIEPEEGKWNSAATEHYKKVLRKMKELGLVRMVTLHHFTLPLWLAQKGGFETKEGVEAFARFAWFVAQNLGDEIDLWVTINEPEVYSIMSYRNGVWPPFRKSLFLLWQATQNIIKAHKTAYSAIKKVLPDAQIGIAKNNVYYEVFRKNNFFDRFAVRVADRLGNHYILKKVKNHLDFIGLNYYFYSVLKFDFKKVYETKNSEGPKSDMGWRTYPEGIYYLLRDLKKYGRPIFITENGIANAADDMRQDFIRQHLGWTLKAVEDGAGVKGYFYWSLTDTYEWHDGFNPKFGLVEVDFSTQRRRVRESAKIFKEIQT